MRRDGLLLGPLAAALFVAGILALAAMVPDYSHIHQTVSEIGEKGSPAQVPFTVLLLAIAICVALFATALRNAARAGRRSTLAARLTGCMAVSIAGVGVFSFPDPLHNWFGISELVGYMAPLAFAVTWRRDASARTLVTVSWILFLVIAIAIVLNLSSLYPGGSLWRHVHPMIGLAQRALFAGWLGWCAMTGLLLFRRASARAL